MRLRTSEGRNGMLSALVLPWGEKTAVSIDVPIKALNLHTRFQFNEGQLTSMPTSIIEVTGKFEIEEALIWLNTCLPDVPMGASQSTSLVLCYKSSFLGTLLHLRLVDGLIEVKTDNLSVLAIIKDSVSASAG